jgi:hypothetical protein
MNTRPSITTSATFHRDRITLLTVFFFFYYAILFFLFLDGRSLSQYQPVFFQYNRDLTELALIATGLPRWMIAHPFTFPIADALAVCLPIPLIRQLWRNRSLSPWPGVIFVACLSLYLLLADIFWQIHHEPFIIFVILALALTTSRADRFDRILRFARWYFLYIFASAAIWKLARGAIFNGHEMSRILLAHHTDLLTGDCTSITCRLYTWLIIHPICSYSLYLGAMLLEAVFLIGFFTRRFDRWLIVLAIVFVIADWLLMRIPYWSLLLGTITLWLRTGRPALSKEKRIVIYETTHHENLPALLDLCEARFTQTAVFLKAVSYQNLTGQGSPEQRWPQTDFFIQTTGCSNRRFIRGLFQFLRRHGYTHLHLATLDNNLMVFALHLAAIGPVHVSLTVHEINEYFHRSFRSLRDCTESIAKAFLHRQIGHYQVFLPAMTDRLRQHLPAATVVFLPSRFYSGHHPPPPALPFKIVIPGTLDPNRRKYDHVIETLALPPLPTTSVELILLGDASTDAGAAILSSFRALAGPGLVLRTFKGYVAENTYEQELACAHLIWSPLNMDKKSSRNSRETYGLTTASGLTADILLNNIPALVPAEFTGPQPFSTAIYPYRSPEEAKDIILRLLTDPVGYASIRNNIHHAFAYFSKENFNTAFEALTDF